MAKTKILLGSNSPRRNELLEQLGVVFTKVSIDCDESFSATMSVEEVAEYLANKKSMAYTQLQDGEVLITADTVVIAKNTILNKPADRGEAIAMLTSLSGSAHHVLTGVCIRSSIKKESFTTSTLVKVKVLATEEIEYYVDVYKPYDKAGAYGIQEWFGLVAIESINGSFYNVVGLPTEELFKRLKNDYDV